MNITKEQARAMACAIYADIHMYVVNHQHEYQAWLREHGYCNEQSEAADSRPYIFVILAAAARMCRQYIVRNDQRELISAP